MGKTIKEALNEARKVLSVVSDIPQKEAIILATHTLNVSETYLFLHEDDIFEKHEKFTTFVKRRGEGEPIEYITNKVSFYSREFFIDKGALIPRPETELLIDEVVKNVKEFQAEELCIAEIGTGSGIISIVLALLLPKAKVIATDISKAALKIAKSNIKKYALEDRIKLYHTSYLDGVHEDIDIIVSNPPYVSNDFKIDKPLEYEPKEAIFGGKKGDEILFDIISITKDKNVMLLACEMGYDQRDRINSYLTYKNLKDFYFYKDLAGLDRGFVVKI